jgi:hypothetical protein
MAEVAVAPRRLPGVVLETQPPPSRRVLPRMDVAAFVGFAAAGPVGVPVVVDDPARFAAVFGEDAPLAWDGALGQPTMAQLAPAVRAFFRNGGRRAWVVRVAAGAETSVLPVPGLVQRDAGGAPAFAALCARSPGSWADQLRVGAALASLPCSLLQVTAGDTQLQVEAGAAAVVAGDLLRVRTGPHTALLAVGAATADTVPAGGGAGPATLTLTVDPAAALWLEHDQPAAGATGDASYLDAAGNEVVAPVTVPAPEPAGSPPAGGEPVMLDLQVSAALAPEPGAAVHGVGLSAVPGRTLRLRVATVGQGPAGAVRVSGPAVWVLAAAPDPRPAFSPGDTVEKLTLELWTYQGATQRLVLDGLGFVPGHPRYVGDLPSDQDLFTQRDPRLGPAPLLWTDATNPRFPLAGPRDGEPPPILYPLDVDVVPATFLGPRSAPGSPLERDGLAQLTDALFLDDGLRAVGTEALAAEADYLRWQSPVPRPLTGVHALLEVEEVTVIAVPDAVHRHWQPAASEAVPPPPSSVEAPADGSPPSPGPAVQDFVDCAVHDLDAPVLTLKPRAPGGSFVLEWTAVDEPGVRYLLQESTDPRSWRRAVAIYAGPERRAQLYGRGAGTFFYRVRAEAGPNRSPWSNGVAVGDPSGPGHVLETEDAYRPDVLLAVQRALLRLCASRGDTLAVLSLPRHYRADAAIAHVRQLRSAGDPPTPGSPPGDAVPPLDGSEQRALGFGGLYRPWLALSAPGEDVRPVPPDGSAAGVIAQRAATRGAWVAPANVPLRDVVALVDAAPPAALAALQEGQVNEVRQEPGGFICLSQDTLSQDPDLRPINVRRLLALVRRLALLEGAQYAFEPNDPTFRRGVERGFTDVMQLLYRLGAFAGATAEEAFRVNVASPPNTPQSLDQGRLIVELKLAASRPLTFLLVRLVHAAERGFALETP